MTSLPLVSTDETLLDEICGGNDDAFNALVQRYHTSMIRIARAYVPSAALAEEAVQEAWMAIFKTHRNFQRRSALKTWMFRIVINRARTHASRESRGEWLRELNASSIDDARFDAAGSWVIPPHAWTPEQALLGSEVRQRIEAAIAVLPILQRQVITLRDVYGWSADEVCDLYRISDANQRIVLHRARTRVRQALEEFFSSEVGSCQPM